MGTIDCSKMEMAGRAWAFTRFGRFSEMGRAKGIVTNI